MECSSSEPFRNGGLETLKSNLRASLAGFESEDDGAGATLANRVWRSPGDAVHAIATGDATVEPPSELILAEPTMVSPAVGEPRCTNETIAEPVSEPELPTTILATCVLFSTKICEPSCTDPAPSKVNETIVKSGAALADVSPLDDITGEITGAKNRRISNEASEMLDLLLCRNTTSWGFKAIDVNFLTLAFPLSEKLR